MLPMPKILVAAAAVWLSLTLAPAGNAWAEQAQPKVYDPTTGLLKSKPLYDPTTGLSRQNKPDFDPTTGMPNRKTPLYDPTTGLSTSHGVVVNPASPAGPNSLDPDQATRYKVITVRVYSATGQPLQALVKAVGDGVDFSASRDALGGVCRFAVPCCASQGQLVAYRFTAYFQGRSATNTTMVSCGAQCNFPTTITLRIPVGPAVSEPATKGISPTKTRDTPTTIKRYTTGSSQPKKEKPKRYSPTWRPWQK